MVKVGNNLSTPLILNTGAPQGCVLSPLLYSLFTHDCVAMYASNLIINLTDDTTVVGLITNNDECGARKIISYSMLTNVDKTNKLIVDSRGSTHISTSTGPQRRRWKVLSSLAYTSRTN